MWKYVRKGVRDSLERSLGWKEAPRQQRCSKFTSFCRSVTRSRPSTAVQWCQSRPKFDQPPPNNEEDPPNQSNRNSHFTEDPKESILGAVSCSSALVLGWVLTQPYYHWLKWWRKDGGRWDLKSHCPLARSLFVANGSSCCRPRLYDPISSLYDPITSLFRRLSIGRLLPVSLAAPHDPPVLLANSADQEEPKQIEYGPITADQALEEAVDEVREAHDRALSVWENRRGVDAASRHRHAKAVALFRAASARSYPPAQYNLAQCYELGLGTKQDFSLAAEWYNKAAELGHPGAMYNLAVFHAHGWGGLEADSTKARKLLVKAAEKGQPDAMAALGYPGQPPPPSVTPVIDKEDLWTSPSEHNSGISEEHSDYCDNVSNNPTALYNLAQSFEKASSETSPDPYLIMDLYKFASELGHSAAKARFQILQTYDAIGLLSDYLILGKEKPSNLCDKDLLLETK